MVWPYEEDKLCNTILKLQFCIGILALLGRHAIGAIIFGHDNLWTVR